MTKVLVLNIAKNMWKSIADTHVDTAYGKYRRYLRQCFRSIADAIGSNTDTAILTILTGIARNVQFAVDNFCDKFLISLRFADCQIPRHFQVIKTLVLPTFKLLTAISMWHWINSICSVLCTLKVVTRDAFRTFFATSC